MFRPFEEPKLPSYIIQDDFSDMPFDLYCKDMEIPKVDIQLKDGDLLSLQGCDLAAVSETLKGPLSTIKEYRNRERVGKLAISIDHSDYVDDVEMDDDGYDPVEQVFVNHQSSCKAISLYGRRDLRDIPIYRLTKMGKQTLLIEVPLFQNYILYNVLTQTLLSQLSPNSVSLVVEGVEGQKSDDILDSLHKGRTLTGIDAALFNGARSTDVPVVFVPLVPSSRDHLYI